MTSPTFSEFTPELIRKFVAENPRLVKRVQVAEYPGLSVLKYQRRVFFDNLWNDILMECRGTVIDDNFIPVVLPLRKMFNYGENNTKYDRDRQVYVERKINGFMGAATYVESRNEVIYSTTGSITSDFAKLARSWLAPFESYFRSAPGWTFVFEIVDPTDPHIIPEEHGPYLLGIREARWGSWPRSDSPDSLDITASQMSEEAGVLCRRPEWDTMRFSDVVQKAKTVKHEGFVVYPVDHWFEHTGLKIKSPYYLVTKFFARMHPEKFDKLVASVQQAKSLVDEEYYPMLEYLNANASEFSQLDEQSRIKYIERFLRE